MPETKVYESKPYLDNILHYTIWNGVWLFLNETTVRETHASAIQTKWRRHHRLRRISHPWVKSNSKWYVRNMLRIKTSPSKPKIGFTYHGPCQHQPPELVIPQSKEAHLYHQGLQTHLSKRRPYRKLYLVWHWSWWQYLNSCNGKNKEEA